MRRCLIRIMFLFFCLPLWSQKETILVGEVYDECTGEPMEGVSVYLKNTPYGTATTPEGVFLLRVPLKKKSTMVVSAVGYRKQTFTIEPGISAGIDVALREKSESLAEVFIVPGSNPALPIMERVRQKKQINNVPVNGDNADKNISVSVSDIRAKHLKRALWRSLKKAMLTQEDSTLLLPLYAKHSSAGQTKEQKALLTSTHWEMLLSDFEQPKNFYNSTVPFLAASFLSPLAADANSYYQFYLADSLTLPRKNYTIHFRTKNPYYPTFNGTLCVDSLTAAITYISAEVPSDVNVNYLRGLTIEQTYQCNQDCSRYVKETEDISMLLDFAIKADTSHVFPSLLLRSNSRYPLTMRNTTTTLLADAPTEKIYQTDTLYNNIPLFRAATWMAQIIQTGYIPTGTMVDIGKVTEIIHANPHEGVRLGLPLRTNERMSKTVCLEGYLAAGLGDHAWKGAGMIHLNLPTQRRHILTFRYADEYVRADVSTLTRQQRENSVWFSDMSVTMQLMQMARYWETLRNPAIRRREASVRMDNDWTDHLETRLALNIGKEGYGMPTRNYNAQPTYRYANISATVRLGWDERKLDFFFQRLHLYGDKPALFLNAELGSIRMAREDNYHVYGKLGFLLRQRANLGMGGILDWQVAGGLLLGHLPYTRLHLFEGNQSYAYDPYRFTLMDYTQFAADRYLLLHAQWNGKGCVFNRIPYIQRLRLRELLIFKLAYGGWTRSNTLCLPNNYALSTLTIPYIEVGAGIGNIFRVADLYAVFKLTHRNDSHNPFWAIRFRLHIDT